MEWNDRRKILTVCDDLVAVTCCDDGKIKVFSNDLKTTLISIDLKQAFGFEQSNRALTHVKISKPNPEEHER